MIKEGTVKLVDRINLTLTETEEIMNEIMSGKATSIETASFLTALQAKGATVEEITACAKVMRSHAMPLEVNGDLLEIVGTGGDKSFTFNISTTSALVAAAAGCRVAKHGNRAATSKSGAADVLEELGADIRLDARRSEAVLKKTGFCFLFAQQYHKSMKYVAPVRKELAIPTVFNLLGPLTNPAHASIQVLGVYKEELVEPLARVLQGLGVRHGMAVFGTDQMDEISASAATKVCEFEEGGFKTYTIRPEDFGLQSGTKEELTGGTPAENAAVTRGVLNGEIRGTKRNAVLLNAGAGLYVAGRAESLQAGVTLAGELIDDGKAAASLNAYIAATHAV